MRSQTIFEIVGVATDERHESLQAILRPGVYLPFAQLPVGLPMKIFIRGTSEVGTIVPAARREVRAIDQRLPVYDVKTMREVLSNAAAQPRFVTFLLLGFAGVALLLSAVGIYGVMAYLVTQHTREIGLRVALGAQPRDVLRLIIGQGLTLSIIGAGLGLGGAFALARLLTNQLYGVTAHDQLTFVGVATLLISVSVIASFLPARRALKIDPMIALRYE